MPVQIRFRIVSDDEGLFIVRIRSPMSPWAKRGAGLPGSPPGHTPWSRWATLVGKVVLTFALGGAGGWLLAQVGAPAPWLTGSMLAVAAAALSGLPLAMPTWIRTLGLCPARHLDRQCRDAGGSG